MTTDNKTTVYNNFKIILCNCLLCFLQAASTEENLVTSAAISTSISPSYQTNYAAIVITVVCLITVMVIATVVIAVICYRKNKGKNEF